MTDKCMEALAELVAAASDYVKPRRATDARQVLLTKLDAARAALAQPAEPEELTDEGIRAIHAGIDWGEVGCSIKFARAIERAIRSKA